MLVRPSSLAGTGGIPGNDLTAVLRPLIELLALLERDDRDVPPRAGDVLSEVGPR